MWEPDIERIRVPGTFEEAVGAPLPLGEQVIFLHEGPTPSFRAMTKLHSEISKQWVNGGAFLSVAGCSSSSPPAPYTYEGIIGCLSRVSDFSIRHQGYALGHLDESAHPDIKRVSPEYVLDSYFGALISGGAYSEGLSPEDAALMVKDCESELALDTESHSLEFFLFDPEVLTDFFDVWWDFAILMMNPKKGWVCFSAATDTD